MPPRKDSGLTPPNNGTWAAARTYDGREKGKRTAGGLPASPPPPPLPSAALRARAPPGAALGNDHASIAKRAVSSRACFSNCSSDATISPAAAALPPPSALTRGGVGGAKEGDGDEVRVRNARRKGMAARKASFALLLLTLGRGGDELLEVAEHVVECVVRLPGLLELVEARLPLCALVQ